MKEQEEKSVLSVMRHSAEHVLMQAMKKVFGEDKIIMAMGPSTDEGFYFDFDSPEGFEISEENFGTIEAEMRKIKEMNQKFERREISINDARKLFKENQYKQEWLDEIEETGQKATVYANVDKEGNEVFVDLCKGPHVDSTSQIGEFKLLSIAGAYWRGDEKNKMLTRIYGTTFKTKKELEQYLEMQEVAKESDHRKLGKELKLFVFSDLVGKGLPLWTERGATVRRELERFIVDEEIKRGYLHVYTPDLASLNLYRTSGHYPYYKDTMYAPIKIDEEEFMLRPMTCPHHFALYQSEIRSYKQLPMRIAELAKLYRYEKSGELTGLMRVRSFCLADAHIICTQEQAEQEIKGALDLIEFAASVLGFKANVDYRYRLSLGDRENEKKYYKDDKAWDDAEEVLRSVLSEQKVDSYEAKDEAAFYGPKIDIQMKNVAGKEDTAFTVQYDFVMPKRFNLKYVDKDTQEKEPVVIHRSSIGAIERVMAFLIERYKGAFPTWLSPEQVALVPIGEDNHAYADKLEKELKEAGIRVLNDKRDEMMQGKIRDAQEMKIPYMLILGKREEEQGNVSIRFRDRKENVVMKFEEFKDKLLQNIKNRKLELDL